MIVYVKKALLICISWSIILLYINIIGMFYGFILSYAICCSVLVLIFAFNPFLYYESPHQIVYCLLIIMLLSPILMYVIWLFTIYHLISELEKVV